MSAPNLISIQETAETNIHATGAKLTVSIKGQSFFTKEEAFTKTDEVSNCVDELQKCGLSKDNIKLLNISIDVEDGILTKSSKTNYDLLLNCESVELLGRILDTISLQKDSKLNAILWQYTQFEEIKQELS